MVQEFIPHIFLKLPSMAFLVLCYLGKNDRHP